MALSKPICGSAISLTSYMKFQITPAPTMEIAIGKKINDLAIFSKRLRSANTATNKPKTIAREAPKIIHKRLLRKAVIMVRSVKTEM